MINELPELAQHFAAELALTCFAIADHAAAGAQHGDSHSVEYRLQFGRRGYKRGGRVC